MNDGIFTFVSASLFYNFNQTRAQGLSGPDLCVHTFLKVYSDALVSSPDTFGWL